MSDRHTPGPWVVDYDNSDDGSGGQWYVSGPARVWFPYSASEDDVRKALANARLIAAAPDLLDVAESIVAWADASAKESAASGQVFCPPPFVKPARDAVAKAAFAPRPDDVGQSDG